MKSLSLKAVVAMAAMSAVISSVPAKADLADLAALMRSPVGRYLMLETEEGLAITMHAMGSSASAGTPEIDEVISRMGSREMESSGRELEERLSNARSRLQAMVSVHGELDALDVLQKLAADGLASKVGEGGTLEFVSENHENYKADIEAFMGQAQPSNKLATMDMSGHVFEPHVKMVEADMRFADLSGSEALFGHFDGAKMEFANLSEAQMPGADFHGANLEGAELRGGKFKDASFRNAKLRGADMRSTNLMKADLRGADLRGANLSGATMGQIGFQSSAAGINLRGALVDAHTVLPEGITLEQAKKLGATVLGG